MAVHILFRIFLCVSICGVNISGYPVDTHFNTKYLLVPIRFPEQTPKGPLDFIGNLIQSSNFLPIEINVPDTFSTIGNTVGGWANNVGNFAQNVGTSVQSFTQNVGSGIQSLAQGLSQRVPFLAAIVRPNGSTTQRFVVLIPIQDSANAVPPVVDNLKTRFSLNMNQELIDVFP